MSQLQVTKITTVDNTTPLILATGNAGGGQIIIQSSNTDVFFNGNLRLSSLVTGDGSGLTLPSSNIANAAFDTANAAYASANNVAPQVTPAYNTANVAFNTANAAFASANNVAPQVTPAFNTANLAFLNSNVAFDTANAAFASANNVAPQVTPSYNTANAAFNTANAAYNAANNVGPQIAPAYTAANNAYNTANAAYNYANASNTYAESTFLKLTAPSQTVTGNLTVTGNFTLLGNATSISSNNLIVGDSMIYLAANNYSGTDILDIGFVANYANGTGANVHTGLLRDATTKQYYLFNGLDIELQANNTSFTPGANGVTNAVLNADLYTSNLILGGANAINWITAAYAKANASGANVGQTAPASANGALWWNSDLGRLFIYYTDPANTGSWVEASPSAATIEAAIITGYINPVYNASNAAYTTTNSAYGFAGDLTISQSVYINGPLRGVQSGAARTVHITANNNIEMNMVQADAKANGKIWNFLVDGGSGSANSNYTFRQLSDYGGGISRGFTVNGETGVFATLESRKISPASVPAGSVIQTIWKDLGTGSYSGSGGTYANTSFTATITPQYSTSKIYMIITIGVYLICDGNVVVYRNGSSASPSLFDSYRSIASGDYMNDMPPYTATWMDSPGTTSQLTYSIWARATGCAQSPVFIGSSSDFTSSWTLMEIAQ